MTHELRILPPEVHSPHRTTLKAVLFTTAGREFHQYMDIESTGNGDIDEDDLADAWCIFFIHKMMETGGEFTVTGPGSPSCKKPFPASPAVWTPASPPIATGRALQARKR